MSSFKNKLTFVVPTKDRPKELRRMLQSLAAQTCLPHARANSNLLMDMSG